MIEEQREWNVTSSNQFQPNGTLSVLVASFNTRKRRRIEEYIQHFSLPGQKEWKNEKGMKPCRLTQALIIYLFGTGDKKAIILSFQKEQNEREREIEIERVWITNI